MTIASRLAGLPAIEAQSILRIARGLQPGLAELPASELFHFDSFRSCFAGWIRNFEQFVERYNSALDAWREERKINNPANPFPNLKSTGASVAEMPLWLVDRKGGTRHALWCRRDEHDAQRVELRVESGSNGRICGTVTARQLTLQDDDHILVPRGAMISFLFRWLASDLFVHGTGGANYDRFTDAFSTRWVGRTPAPYVGATASRYLLPDRRHELQLCEEWSKRIREIKNHPQKSFATGLFDTTLEEALKTMLEQKQDLITQLAARKKTGEPAGEIGRALQQFAVPHRSASGNRAAATSGTVTS